MASARATRDALPHAARELVRASCRAAAREIDQRDVTLGVLAPSAAAGQSGEDLIDREGDVLVDGQPGQQRVVLEDHAAVGSGPRDFLAVQRDAARVGLEQSGDERDQRGLARARIADDGDELALLDRRG